MNDVQIQPDGSSEEILGVWGDVMTQGKADTRQREAREDERTGRQGWRVGDRIRVTSDTKPFKGATGIVRAVEGDGWRLAPYYLYRVELAVGLVSYEYGELELLVGRTGEKASSVRAASLVGLWVPLCAASARAAGGTEPVTQAKSSLK